MHFLLFRCFLDEFIYAISLKSKVTLQNVTLHSEMSRSNLDLVTKNKHEVKNFKTTY